MASKPRRRVSCRQCDVLVKAEYVDERGQCDACQVQDPLFTLPGDAQQVSGGPS